MTTYLVTLVCISGFGQLANRWHRGLPVPTGKFGIGRMTIEWTDDARIEPLSVNRRNRELLVDIWYPTEQKIGPSAQYLNVAAFDQAMDSTGLQSLTGIQAANLIRTGIIQTHAFESAPFARKIKHAPVLIFSHGMGMVTQLYTAQIEDLVSHGYVVVAITHPYDAWLVTFRDGRYITFERDRREAAGNSEEAHIAYENTRVEWWANDIRFVLDKLTDLNRNILPEMPFAGHLDLQRVGAFGHSVGGRAAARACQLDSRLCACADQDGVAKMMPFYINESGLGMNQPFLLIVRERTTPPTDDELRKMGFTRLESSTLVAQLKDKRDSALSATGGSFRVVLNFEETDHMSFSDLPMLQARNSEEAAICTRIFRVTSAYTREFFDKELRGMKAPLFEGEMKLEYVDMVQRYLQGQYLK